MLGQEWNHIWYALARLPNLSATQRACLAEIINDDAWGDPHLQAAWFGRPELSDAERLTMIRQIGTGHRAAELLASPAATASHVRFLTDLYGPEWRALAVLAHRPELATDEDLLDAATAVASRLPLDEAQLSVRDWPSEVPIPEPIRQALVDGMLSQKPPDDYAGYRQSTADPPLESWQRVWRLISSAPDAWAPLAARSTLAQAALLHHANDLALEVLAACVPVCSDPDLTRTGYNSLSVTGRLQTLHSWAHRHPALPTLAAAAFRAAVEAATTAIQEGYGIHIATEAAGLTSDPAQLAALAQAVAEAIASKAGSQVPSIFRDPELASLVHDLDRQDIDMDTPVRALAGNPEMPPAALAAILPALPISTVRALAEDFPALAEDCQAEELAFDFATNKIPTLGVPRIPHDEELASADDPSAALLGYLLKLSTLDSNDHRRLAVALLRSQFADDTVLRALPVSVVTRSPWHSERIAELVTEACGDEKRRWAVLPDRLTLRRGSFGSVLDEIRSYKPETPLPESAAYRYCHACQLITPTRRTRSELKSRIGWTDCLLCDHLGLPGQPVPADTDHSCDACGGTVYYPTVAAVAVCDGCDQMYFNPDLPVDLRTRVDNVLERRRRTAKMVRDLCRRIDAFTADTPLGLAERSGLQSSGFPAPPVRWLRPDREPAEQFRKALQTIARTLPNPQHRIILQRHYGLSRGRGQTLRQIAAELGRQQTTVSSNLTAIISDIRRTAMRLQHRPDIHVRACTAASWLAREAIGNPCDSPLAIAERLDHFLARALPTASGKSAAKLLLCISAIEFSSGPPGFSSERRWAEAISQLVASHRRPASTLSRKRRGDAGTRA